MDSVNGLAVVMRFGHLLGGVAVVGGPLFAAFVIMPALRGLVDEARQAAFEEVRRRLAWLFAAGLVLLIISGVHRFVSIEWVEHHGQVAYHALFGVKILLMLAVVTIGYALLSRGKFLASMREHRRKWMKANLQLVVLIVALSVVLAAMPKVGI